MVFKIPDIMRDVRTAMDENMTSDALTAIGDIDTLSLDDIIRSKVAEASRRVELSAPQYLLEEGHTFGDAVYWGDHNSGWVLLPDDFMRLISFRMSDWEKTLYTAISADAPLYARQSSRYKGIRGNTQKPVCAIVNRPEGKALEFYSCKSQDAYVAQGTYLPYPAIDAYDGIDLCERCYTSIVYMTASLVSSTFGDTNKASSFLSLSQSLSDL